MKKLTSQIKLISELTFELRNEMFALYSQYYEGTSELIFQQDLQKKNYVFLLYDRQGSIKGFSTLAVFNYKFAEKTVKILYSGDTIIDHPYWGQHELAAAWIYFAGEIKAQFAGTSLYWLLIVKGYRTYRYLSVFSKRYYPCVNESTPPEMQHFIDQLAAEQFGAAYDKTKGIVHFPTSNGHLKTSWANIPEKAISKPEVTFFLARNPEFYRGDELVCLCELSAENLRPFAKRLFLAGSTTSQEKTA